MKKNYFNHNYKIIIEKFLNFHVVFLYRRILRVWFCIRIFDGHYVHVVDIAQQWIDTYRIPSANILDLT